MKTQLSKERDKAFVLYVEARGVLDLCIYAPALQVYGLHEIELLMH